MGKIHAGRPDKIFISLITHSYHMLILFALNTGVPTMDVFVVGERRMSALIATKNRSSIKRSLWVVEDDCQPWFQTKKPGAASSFRCEWKKVGSFDFNQKYRGSIKHSLGVGGDCQPWFQPKKQERYRVFVVGGRRLSTLISTEKTRSSIQVFLPPCGAVIIHTRSYSPPFVGREQAK